MEHSSILYPELMDFIFKIDQTKPINLGKIHVDGIGQYPVGFGQIIKNNSSRIFYFKFEIDDKIFESSGINDLPLLTREKLKGKPIIEYKLRIDYVEPLDGKMNSVVKLIAEQTYY